MPLQEIAQWIEDHSSWIIGIDLFVGHLPLRREDGTEPPDRCVIILENTPGALVPELPDRIDKPIQFWNRAKDYFVARDDAMGLSELIHGTSGWNLPVLISGELYLAMTVDIIGPPAPIANPDEKENYIFSTNSIWRIEKDSCI